MCDFLSQAGYDDLAPRYYEPARGGPVVIMGRWKTEEEAKRKLEELRSAADSVFDTMAKMRLILSAADPFVEPRPSTR